MDDSTREWIYSEQVERQLNTLRESARFRDHPVPSKILDHVVRHHLLNDHEQLSEKAVLRKVYGVTDKASLEEAIEKTTARKAKSRLSKELEEYYAEEGAKDEVIIGLDKGSYYPVYRFRGHSTPIELWRPPSAEEGERRNLIGYLDWVIRECGELPIYFPEHLKEEADGFGAIWQRVQVVTKPRQFENQRIEDQERQGSKGEVEYAPLHSRPTDDRGGVSGDKDDAEILDWSDTREPKNDRHKFLFRHMIVLGDAGFGKTWLLKHEAVRLARKAKEEISRHRPSGAIPVFLRLPDLAEYETKDRTLIQSICACLKALGGLPGELVSLIKKLLDEGRVALLLDAWDEVSPSKESRSSSRFLRRKINRLAEDKSGSVVVSSRPSGYWSGALISKATEVQVLAFNPKEIRGFVATWFTSDENAQIEQLLLELKPGSAIGELARVPLLLSLVCKLVEEGGDAPKNREELHRRVLRRLIEDWPKYDDKPGTPLDFYDQIEILGRAAVALDLQAQFTRRRLKAALGGSETTLQRLERAGVFSKMGNDRRVFLHRSVQEYLTAVGLSTREDLSGLVERHSLDPTWHETLTLLGGVLSTKDKDMPRRSQDGIASLRRVFRGLQQEHGECITKVVRPRLALAGRVLTETDSDAAEIASIRDEVFDLLCATWRSAYSDSITAGYTHIRYSLSSLARNHDSLARKLPTDSAFTTIRVSVGDHLLIDVLANRFHNRSANPEIRARSLIRLAELGSLTSGETAELPLSCLANRYEDVVVRMAAAKVIPEMPVETRTAAARLVKCVEDHTDDSRVRSAALRALVAMGERFVKSAESVLVALLREQENDDPIRNYIPGALRWLGPNLSAETIRTLLERGIDIEEDGHVRRVCLSTLSEVASQIALGGSRLVCECLNGQEKDPLTRYHLVNLLGKLPRDDGSTAQLLERVDDLEEDDLVRASAARALQAFGIETVESLKILQQADIDEQDFEERLAKSFPDVEEEHRGIHSLINTFNDPSLSPLDRSEAVEDLARQGLPDKRITGLLLACLGDKAEDDSVRASAAGSWGLAATAIVGEVVPSWISCLNDRTDDPIVRSKAAISLGTFFGDDELRIRIVSALVMRMSDKKEASAVRSGSAEALRRLLIGGLVPLNAR